jgi:plastocyanin
MMRRAIAGLVMAWLLPRAGVDAQSGTVHGVITAPDAGITGIVVYLIPTATTASSAAPPLTAEMDQRDLRFVPRVIAVTPGSTVFFSNSDPVMHNVFHPLQHGGFDLGTYPQGERRSFTFGEEGAYVIFCHVHPEMVGYVVVIASPYRAVTDDEGRFRITGVAPGTYSLRTWHRRLRTHDQLLSVPAKGAVRVDLQLVYGSPAEPRAVERPVAR